MSNGSKSFIARLVPIFVAFIAGAISVLAFSPFDQAWVAFPALGVLFHLWRKATPAQAFRLGWVFGIGLLGFGVFWLRNSISQFGGLNLPLAIIITLTFSIALALFYGLAGWLARRLSGGSDVVNLLLIFPACWVLLEWCRGWLFGGFPWLTLGYSQIDWPLAGYANIFGVFGVSLALAVTAAVLNFYRNKWILLLIPLWATAWFLPMIDWSESAGDPIRVSLVQGNIPQEIKWNADQFEPTLDLYLSETSRLSHSDLVIWPETAIPAYTDRVEKQLLLPMDAWLDAADQDLLTGIAVKTDDGLYYNAMISLGASGRDEYYKRHLVPFGEFLPFKEWLKPLIDMLAIPMSDFSAGDSHKPVIKLAGYLAGISICYEDAFGREIIDALPEAAFLVNASNDAWFGDSLAPHQHLQMARMRALETDRYLLRATNTGISAIINRHGALVAEIPQFVRAIITGIVEPRTGWTVYAKFGNVLVVLLLIAMLLLAYCLGGTPSTPSSCKRLFSK